MKTLSLLFTLVAISMFTIGCERPTTNDSSTPGTHDEDHGHDDHEGHDHAQHDHAAPHGGHLIELGRNHEYHAELVDDHETETITVYLMDSHMEPFTLDASSIRLVLTSGDQTETFDLQANQPGGSAEFSSNNKKLMEMIEGNRPQENFASQLMANHTVERSIIMDMVMKEAIATLDTTIKKVES